jgi:hypothetical protein
MPIDKAKDTSPTKPVTANKVVEAKTESSAKMETKPDDTPKKTAWVRVRNRYLKLTKTIGTTFLEKRRSDSTC